MCDVCFKDVCCHGREETRWRRRGKKEEGGGKGEGRGRERRKKGKGRGREGVGRFLEEEGGVRILFFCFFLFALLWSLLWVSVSECESGVVYFCS